MAYLLWLWASQAVRLMVAVIMNKSEATQCQENKPFVMNGANGAGALAWMVQRLIRQSALAAHTAQILC